TEKQGRSGPLMFAEWRHVIEQEGRIVLEELQTIVYRSATLAPPAPPPAVASAANEPEITSRRRISFDAPLLFRFSAVTFNAHRIHYDWPYATQSERYPDLVVHGPLLAILLALEAQRALGDVRRVDFRAHLPVFAHDDVELLGRVSGASFIASAQRSDGATAMTMEASAE
ncbi:MAG TPA: hypothetical protein VME46_06340, partial [Acidimicrobiales bacterium]|nr:hypothetical protein [Acidimicrobiales bacterium]